MHGITSLGISTQCGTTETASMEGNVRENKDRFVWLLEKAPLGGVVEELKPDQETAGATIFPRGAAFRFFCHEPDYGHDGFQVSVNGPELLIRDTNSWVAGRILDDSGTDLVVSMKACLARLKDNRSASRSGEYEIKPGDTLYGLAREFGITVDQLKSDNGLTGNLIRAGDTLKVPQLDY